MEFEFEFKMGIWIFLESGGYFARFSREDLNFEYLNRNRDFEADLNFEYLNRNRHVSGL